MAGSDGIEYVVHRHSTTTTAPPVELSHRATVAQQHLSAALTTIEFASCAHVILFFYGVKERTHWDNVFWVTSVQEDDG